MSEREQLDATSGPMSKGENAKTARVLQDNELDAVSGGTGRSFAVDMGTSEQLVLNATAEGRR
jgi:hypothetical protein